MSTAPEVSSVVDACHLEGRHERLDAIVTQLEICEKALQVCQRLSQDISDFCVTSQSSGSLATLHVLPHTAADILYLILLQDYLETKRRAFPRFYFVAPTDLLDILSKGSNPQLVLRSDKKSCLNLLHCTL